MSRNPKYRKYISSRDGRKDMDPMIPPTPPGREHRVVARRKGGTAGLMTLLVRADSPEHAMEMVRTGEVPAIGLGWAPISAEEV